MTTISEALAIAVDYHRGGRLDAAEQIYRQILAVEPNQADAWNLLGVVRSQRGDHQAAAEFIGRAIGLARNTAAYHSSLGNVYQTVKRRDEAVACYRRALELNPQFSEAHNNLGAILQEQGKRDEAVECYRAALALKPDFAEAHNNLGNALKDQGKRDEAVACYRTAIGLKPNYAEAHNNLGAILQEQGQRDEAVAQYRRALELKPDYAEACNNLGTVLRDQGKQREATACYQRALELKPDYAEAFNNLGNALQDQGKQSEAVASYRRALELKPNYLAAICALARELQQMCAWEDLQGLSRRIIEIVDEDTQQEFAAAVPPFSFLALPTMTTAEQQLRCARQWVDRRLKLPVEPGRNLALRRPSNRKSKITIGYLSADFRSHALATLIVELFERHDRARFSIFGYSYGRDDGSPMRHRLVHAFDRFEDLQGASYMEAAQRIAADEVDILIDLAGYTANSRTQIMALRPAPIQVNYLGYVATMGASFMDYILVDDFVVPPEQQPFFAEKLVHLPGCYMVNDSRREIAPRSGSRAECGLPNEGFVFCCFNNNYKITPAMFAVWMKLLEAVEGSVLWLLECNHFVVANLRREAVARGVAAERLVFAPHLPLAEHLARHRLADLFLDTIPYNAHTTASEALWAGCPVLTIAGETFASRVAGSLLRAVGLPELVTTRLDAYEQMALRLARDPKQLADLRARLRINRATSSVFDGGKFATTIEQAYVTMCEIHASGKNPRAFRVTPP